MCPIGPWVPPNTLHTSPTNPLPQGLLPAHALDGGKNNPDSVGLRESTWTWYFSIFLGKRNKGSLSIPNLALQTYNLKNYPSRGTKEFGESISYKASESITELKEDVSLLKPVSKTRRSDSFFKCKENNAKLQGTRKIKDKIRPPKKQ